MASEKLETRSEQVAAEAELAEVLSLQPISRTLNTDLLACNLPPELLLRIFQVFRDLWDTTAVVRISQTCRFWRDVALQAPLLWTLIDLGNMRSISTLLLRSGDAPLTLKWHYGKGEHTQPSAVQVAFQELLLPHLRRFVTVEIVLLPGRYVEILSPFLESYSWDGLQTLTLEAAVDPTRMEECFPASLTFDGRPPHDLHFMKIHRIALRNWDTPQMYSRLRTLSLSEHLSIPYPTMAEFLDVLEACAPVLLHLKLFEAGPEPLDEDVDHYPSPIRTVNLQSLQTLCLHLNTDVDVAYLLAHLIVPETTSVELSTENNQNYPKERIGPFGCIPRDHSNLHFFRQMTSVQVSAGAYDWILSSSRHGIESDGGRDIRIAVETPQSGLPYFTFTLFNIARTFERNSLTFLTIFFFSSYTIDVPVEDWTTVLAGFPSLTELRMLFRPLHVDPYAQQRSVHPLLLALGGSESRSHLCPSLKSLVLGYLQPEAKQALAEPIQSCVENRRVVDTSPPSFQITFIEYKD